MSTVRYLALATAALTLASCFKKNDENYDTVDGGSNQYESNPYGVPGDTSAESVPYQPVNPPADANPTYGQAAYEDHGTTTPAPSIPSAPTHYTTPAAPSGAGTSHVVVRGDTLGGIARKYGTTSAAIKQANGMTSDTVVLGKTLAIPGSSGPVKSAPATSGGSSKVHLVVKGDSLGKIAAKYGTTGDAIKKANGMKSDTVVLGSKLRIP